MSDDQQDRVICRWRAEQESHPSEVEKELWYRTIQDLQRRIHSETNQEVLADLHHRLMIAHLKMEDYGAALGWAERGLLLKVPTWDDRLMEGKAEVLFLLGREAESMRLLNELYPREPPVICRLKSEEPRPHRTIVSLGLVCPECGYEMEYGARACPECGRPLDECFRLVKRSRSVLGPYEKGVECQTPKAHRTKEFKLFFTTYTIDFDDQEGYMTAVQDLLLGSQKKTVTTKGWVLWPPLVAAMAISIVFILAGMAATNLDNGGLLIAALAVLGAIVVLPLLIFFAWVAIPPRDRGGIKNEG
jgi:hypothetical protein